MTEETEAASKPLWQSRTLWCIVAATGIHYAHRYGVTLPLGVDQKAVTDLLFEIAQNVALGGGFVFHALSKRAVVKP